MYLQPQNKMTTIMNVNVEFQNGNKTIGLFFHKSESLIDEKFENLTSLIDGLANGVFGFHPYTGYEDDLKKFIRSTKDEYETIFVKIDSSGVYFGHLKSGQN